MLSTLTSRSQDAVAPDYLSFARTNWVDSVLHTMTMRQKVGQLFMVAGYSNKSNNYEDSLVQSVKELGVGGVIFFQGGPVRQAMLTNRLQDSVEVPLLIAMDAEWGLKMRLDSTTRFPYAMTLGAVRDPHLVYEAGAAVADDCRHLGVHINFAPVLDVNNNPGNPVINFRSFGEDPYEVLWRGHEFASGLQDNGIMAVGKHFPGHGDTGTDSHLDLPTIPHDLSRLDSVELMPFRFAVRNGIGGMMVAHLNVPAMDSSGIPTTLSERVIKGTLRKRLGFEGLVFTDALNMKGVTKYYQPGEVDLKALKAGNDILLFPEDVPVAIDLIIEAVNKGEINHAEIEQKCRKVLAAKYHAGLHEYKPINTTYLLRHLNTPEDEWLNMKLAEASLTVTENKQQTIPVKSLKDKAITLITIGEEHAIFSNMVSKYAHIEHIALSNHDDQIQFEKALLQIEDSDLVIVGVMDVAVYPRNHFGLSAQTRSFLSNMAESGKAIVVHFGNPYALATVEQVERAQALIVAYQKTPYTQKMAPQLIFGATGASGTLPVSVGNMYKRGAGLRVADIGRLKYTVPEDAGLDSRIIKKMDAYVRLAISKRATPGCQVLAAKDGKVIWDKAYGHHTYDSMRAVTQDDMYDLASITKVAAATTALMKLYEEGKFDLDANLGDYIAYFKCGDKDEMTFREILAHQAGFKSWIPYWKRTIKKNGKFKWFTFKRDSSKRFPVKVADDLYLHRRFTKKIYRMIRKSDLQEREYVYSGLSFYLFPEIIRELSGMPFEEYLAKHFYQPLGAYSLMFNPWKQVDLNRMVPTEYDSVFRKELLHGRVHDEGAAMMGGLSTNAGLFSTANDLAKLAQMWCNYGEYGGKRYLKTSTVREFTACQFCDEHGNRRGLGFDRPLKFPHENGNTAQSVSQSSFGHSGFTGTMVWADPAYNIVYVFLSNRVYPTRDNKKLFQFNTRTNVQEVIYEAIQNARYLGVN